jgi:phosphoribosyl 1,2-cyclic phosphate phosphodiesterase
MKAIILGSGTSTGVPMIGCRCRICTSPDQRDRRTRSSLVVRADSGESILIDTSTDLRHQMIRERITAVDAVLFTHTHADHINGIDDLRGFHFIHKRLIPCFGSAETINHLLVTFSYIFKGLATADYAPLLEAHSVAGDPFDLFGCRIIPIPLLHGPVNATGYRINDLAYLVDCSAIPDASLPLLRNLDTLVIDALRYTPHPGHFNIDGALEVIARLRPRRAVLTHLTHEVAHLDGVRLPAGVELAYDGMVLE